MSYVTIYQRVNVMNFHGYRMVSMAMAWFMVLFFMWFSGDFSHQNDDGMERLKGYSFHISNRAGKYPDFLNATCTFPICGLWTDMPSINALQYIYIYIYYGYEPFTIRGKVFQVAYIDGVAAKTIEPNGGWTLMETTIFDFQNMGHFPLRVN